MIDREGRADRCGEREDVNACAAGSCSVQIHATAAGRSTAPRRPAVRRARAPVSAAGSRSPRTTTTSAVRGTWRACAPGEHGIPGTGGAAAAEQALRYKIPAAAKSLSRRIEVLRLDEHQPVARFCRRLRCQSRGGEVHGRQAESGAKDLREFLRGLFRSRQASDAAIRTKAEHGRTPCGRRCRPARC